MPTPREASIWGKIRSDLNQSQQDILNGRYQDAMILNRDILKRIVRMQIDKAVLVSNNLENDINQLFENRLITPATRDQYHAIRSYAEQAESGAAPTAQAANDSFALLKDALSDYVDANEKHRSSSYEPQRFQFSSGYTGPGARTGQGSDAAPEEAAYTEAPVSSEASDASADTAESTDDVRAAAPTTRRASYDASGVNLPLGNTPRRSSTVRHTSNRTSGQRPTRPLRDSERVSSRNGNRRAGAAQRTTNSAVRRNSTSPKKRQSAQTKELDLYSILKYAIPVLCLVLFVILIRVLMNGSNASTIETTPAVTEAMTETAAELAPTVPETTAPAETAAAVYMTTTGVKVRTEPNTDCRVLDVLDAGTQVTYKGEADGWINIDYNGQDGYIKSDYVQPVAAETDAAETPAA